jgi:secondary thiamine-phosphate synthase enzyme
MNARVRHQRLELETGKRIELIDVTKDVAGAVARSGVSDGLVTVGVLHTTAAVVVNENEPRLIDDFREYLARLTPAGAAYLHDDLHLRDADLPPDEPKNGDSHVRALLLRASETLPVHGGRVLLGRWQSIFVVELDGPRRRSVAVTVLGVASGRAGNGDGL